ncbi:hypothetical protein FA15DRAFT_654658 [Coprinopsis marcescibilis]|nr:hypothetical protein FA15DRAFT_654658 [Coprinopsis marcescibilis]
MRCSVSDRRSITPESGTTDEKVSGSQRRNVFRSHSTPTITRKARPCPRSHSRLWTKECVSDTSDGNMGRSGRLTMLTGCECSDQENREDGRRRTWQEYRETAGGGLKTKLGRDAALEPGNRKSRDQEQISIREGWKTPSHFTPNSSVGTLDLRSHKAESRLQPGRSVQQDAHVLLPNPDDALSMAELRRCAHGPRTPRGGERKRQCANSHLDRRVAHLMLRVENGVLLRALTSRKSRKQANPGCPAVKEIEEVKAD